MASCVLVCAVLSAMSARADCQCLANGHTFHHGELTCLQLPSGPELAQCDMVLNISSWKKIQDGCPEATAPSVHVGQPAKLRLSALDTRLTPEVQAMVSEISADQLIDEATLFPRQAEDH